MTLEEIEVLCDQASELGMSKEELFLNDVEAITVYLLGYWKGDGRLPFDRDERWNGGGLGNGQEHGYGWGGGGDGHGESGGCSWPWNKALVDK